MPLMAQNLQTFSSQDEEPKLQVYSMDMGFDIPVRTYSYFWFVEPYAGLNFRMQFQGVKRGDLLILGAGVRNFPVIWDLWIPYAEIGFGRIKGRREIRCVGHLGLGLDINRHMKKRLTLDGVEIGIKGEFLSFRTRKGNSLSTMNPSANLVWEIRSSGVGLIPNLGIELFRYSFNIFE